MSDETLSPDPEHDGEQLAAAYLDGLASPEERARVEASPQLMAMVATFSRVRGQLGDIPPAPVGPRERGVAAALAEFDRLHAAAAPVAPAAPNVVPMRSRRWGKVLTAAAALALVGVVGVAALGSLGSSDSDSSSGAAESDQARTAVDAAGDAPLASQEALGTVAVAGGGSEGGATETTAAGQAGLNTVETIGSIDGPGSPVPQLEQTSDLRALPEPKLAVTPSFAFDCPLDDTQEILAEVTYQGTPAVVVRDTVTGVISAVDSQCTVLASLQP